VATTVVHNAEHALGGGVRHYAHDVFDEMAERFDAGGGSATTEEGGAVGVTRAAE
jgi:DNA-binding ferritin-like protein